LAAEAGDRFGKTTRTQTPLAPTEALVQCAARPNGLERADEPAHDLDHCRSQRASWYRDPVRTLACSTIAMLCACAGAAGGRESGDNETETEASVGSTAGSDPSDPSSPSSTASAGGSSTDEPTLTNADDDDGNGAAECGNGMLELNEDCDDGNTEDSDGCNADCTPSGSILWSQTVGSGVLAVDEGFDVVADEDGNFTVVGYLGTMAGPIDGWIRRYSPMGGAYWTLSHAGPGGGADQILGVALADDGAAYLAGYESAADMTNNALLRKVDTFGADLWTSSFDAPGGTNTVVERVTVDESGSVIVVGYTDSMSAGQEVMLRKYTPDGMAVWTRSYGGDANGNDVGMAVAATSAGSLYVVGYESVPAEGTNMWLGKYDTDGNLLWARSYNGVASLDDYLTGVVTDANDNAFVCGYESSVNYPWHSFVRQYDEDGNIVWTDQFLGETSEGAHCNGIASAPNGDLVVTGGVMNMMIRDVLVRRYTSAGEVRWSEHIPGGAMGPDYGRGVMVDGSGTIYVAGSVDTGADVRDIWVARLSP
jgi:cysteine-rich repeat protein